VTIEQFIFTLFETRWARRLCGWNDEILERARDLTREKFARMSSDGSRKRGDGSDCRRHYGNVLRALDAWRAVNPSAHPLALEATTARLLQAQIRREIRRSCLEARRRCNPLRSRYAWKLDGGEIYVWLPTTLEGLRRRDWLEKNVSDPDPRRSGESERAQAIIDRYWGVPRLVSLSSDPALTHRGGRFAAKDWGPEDERIQPTEFAQLVAREKVQQIDRQRDSIRALGPEKLNSLITGIISQLADGTYDQKKIAEAYQIKESSLSRFAGAEWEDLSHVPDLWVNCAQVLSANEGFVDAAIAAGLWDTVRTIVERNGRGQSKRGAAGNENLYFIPIVTDALRQPDPTGALHDAFAKITAQGKAEPFRVGYQQFLCFLIHSVDCWEAHPWHPLRDLWPRPLVEARSCRLQLLREDRMIATLSVDRFPFRTSIDAVTPGAYRLETDTGWRIWEAALSSRELIWTLAFPALRLPFAAQTDDLQARPAYEATLLSGALIVRAFPGLEHGRLEIFCKLGGKEP
jgi:hypothetical protein